MRLGDLDELKDAVVNNFDNLQAYFPRQFIEEIDNAPTVPLPDFKDGYKQAIIDGKTNFARPQGEWIETDIPESVLCKCSVCGFDLGAYSFNFCPNCGADMRGDSDYGR